jgi:hypothetical protein
MNNPTSSAKNNNDSNNIKIKDIIVPNPNQIYSPKSPVKNDYLNNTDSNILNQNPQLSFSNKLSTLEHIKEKEEFSQTQDYINYLKIHLDSSYYAFNEIKNKNSVLLNKTKTLNNEIKKNNLIYQKLLKSFEEKKKENDEYKVKYEKILENKIKGNKNINNDIDINEKIENIKKQNLILSKENKSKENIILNLKKTLEILEKNKDEKKKDKLERINELKKELNSINKMKNDFEEISKELYIKSIELEKAQKTMEYLIKLKSIKNSKDNDEVEEKE